MSEEVPGDGLSAEDRKARKEAKKAEKELRIAKAKEVSQSDKGAAAPPPKEKSKTVHVPRQPPVASIAAKDTTPPPTTPSLIPVHGSPDTTTTQAPIFVPQGPPPPCLPPFVDLSLVHPRVAELGLLYRTMRIVGGNARTLAMIEAMSAMVHHTPSLNVDWMSQRDKDSFFHTWHANVNYLQSCRMMTPGMQTVCQALENHFRNITFVTSDNTTGEEAHPSRTQTQLHPRTWVLRELARLKDEILMASLEIVTTIGPKMIEHQDVILTFGRSSTIEALLRNTISQKSFAVIVVDSAPLFEGRTLSAQLQKSGVPTTYVLLSAISLCLPKCTKVFIGASTVLLNGDVHSRAGTSVVALMANALRKPVLCFVESYKLTTKFWVGSLTVNEVCRPSNDTLTAEEAPSGGGYLYDITPAATIDVLVSEYGRHHPMTVATLSREREQRTLGSW